MSDNKASMAFSEAIHNFMSAPAQLMNCSDLDPHEILITAEDAGIPSNKGEYVVDRPEGVQWSTDNGVVENENGLASLSPADIAKLVALIQEMRCSNTNLLERVIQLEQALAECQNDVHTHRQRSRATESMLNQQMQEYVTAQERVKSLLQELDSAYQSIKHQETSVETLTTQLSISQERIAQMERECSQAQANYSEKLHQTMQAENTCRELRSRLIRQQRYTMQLKVALEKCMEVPVQSYQFGIDISSASNYTTTQTAHSKPTSLFPKAEPIIPWSVKPSAFNHELETNWTESTVDSQWLDHEPLTTDDHQPITFDSVPSCTPNEQSFCFNQDFNTTSDDASSWQDLFNLLEAAEPEDSNYTANLPPLNDFVASDIQDFTAPTGLDDFESKSNEPVVLPANQFQPPVVQPKTSSSQINPNWPSPVVYPLHPPKGRKSLSAIELPKFNNQ